MRVPASFLLSKGFDRGLTFYIGYNSATENT